MCDRRDVDTFLLCLGDYVSSQNVARIACTIDTRGRTIRSRI
jgi:hypothetical protein